MHSQDFQPFTVTFHHGVILLGLIQLKLFTEGVDSTVNGLEVTNWTMDRILNLVSG